VEEPVLRAARRFVLSADFRRVRSEPGPAALALAGGAVVGVLAAVLPGLVFPGSSHPAGQPRANPRPLSTAAQPRETTPARATTPATVSPTVSTEVAAFRAALARGVDRARTYRGRVAAAVWVDSWPRPVVLGDDSRASLRLWSMSKPITAIAAKEVAAERRRPLPPAFGTWMEAALTRSENCAQRQMVVALQEAAGGPSGARAAFVRVLRQAGASALVSTRAASPDLPCVRYRSLIQGTVAGDEDPALQLGTAEWTITDAVSFAHALGAGVYGRVGREVEDLMARPKAQSREQQPQEFTAPIDWGAGRAFAGWNPAYKAGWGGTRQSNFLAGQYVVVSHRGHTIAAAAVFRPSEQSSLDDPGRTAAPQALGAIFAAVRDEAARRFGG
jgi:hypothetical protein